MRKILSIVLVLFVTALLVPSVYAKPGNGNNGGFEPVTVCHWAGNPSGTVGHYQVITVDNQGQLNGHDNHELDIVPAPTLGCPTVPPVDDDGDDDDSDDDLGIICVPPAYLNEDETGCITDDVPGDEDPGDEPGDEDPGDEPGDDTPNVTIGTPVVIIPGPDLEEVTVWSNLPVTGVAWLIQDAGGTWHQIIRPDGSLIVTPLEYRDRFNRDQSNYESDHPMSRLVLGENGDTNPDHYRAYDPLTGQLVGVWIEFNDEHAQSQDFGSGVAFGSSVNLLSGERWDNGQQTR